MATDKLFSVAGTSKLDGMVKCRWANDVMRVKVLAKSGHEDITLIELPTAMSKLDAVKFIQGLDEFQGVAEQSAIADYLDRKEDTPAPAAKAVAPAKTATVKAPKVKAAPVAVKPAVTQPVSGKTHAQRAAEAALLDDAPF